MGENFDIDLDAIRNEIQEEQSQLEGQFDEEPTGEEHEIEQVEDVETSDEAGIDDEVEDVQEEQEQEQEQEQPSLDKVPDEEEKRNRAFAELRRRAEANEKYAKVIEEIALQAGTTPEELLKRFEQRKLEQEAKAQNVPVEYLQKQKQLEEEIRTLKEQTAAEKFQMQIDKVINTYKANEEEIRATFEYMVSLGIDPRENPNVDFERMYKAANLDRILEREKTQAKQSLLSKKKERQEKAAIPHESGATQVDDMDAILDKKVASIIENW